MSRQSFVLEGTPEQVNALRRCLISELRCLCPSHVSISLNTTSHVDEYIAHRIGLVPFDQTFKENCDDKTSYIKIKGKSIYGYDVTGDIQPFYKDVKILDIGEDQELEMEIKFRTGTGKEHAMYQKTVAVGMESIHENHQKISFECIFGDDNHKECLKEAFSCLKNKIKLNQEKLNQI